jgi:DNA-binding NarL/FixJ family response regulator
LHPAKDTAVSTGRGTTHSVLVVDDDAGFRALVSDALAQDGFDVHEADNGAGAVAAARKQRPSLVVLDIFLPDLSGYEICRELRAEFGISLPILFVSGERIEPFDRVAGLLLGSDDYLSKPVAVDELLARVRLLIERRPSNGAADGSGLTDRERQVLGLLADGLTPAQVADELVISSSTVGTHIEHIYSKLGARTRAHAVSLAYQSGVLEA